MIEDINFEIFEEIVKSPHKQLNKYLMQGKKAVGCFPLYTPDALIHSAGIIPFGLWGAEIEVALAKKYYPAYVCGILQTNLELGMLGAYNGLSAVLITTLCDSLKCATQNWKYAVPNIEMIPVIYPQNRGNPSAIDFLYEQYMIIKNKLENISGIKITNERLKNSIDIYNEHNQVMREFINLAAKYPKEISPKNRCMVIKSGYFMEKSEHTNLVRQLIDKFKAIKPKRFRGIKVVTTGIIADSPNLLDILYENKVSIAADEVAHESRQFRVDTVHESDELMALTKQFMNMYSCSTVIGGTPSREDYIIDLVEKTCADGVIIFMTKFCDPEEYDYPIIKAKLDSRNIPSLLIEVDKQINNYEQARTSIQSFQEMIRL